jgi:hypothetical protein
MTAGIPRSRHHRSQHPLSRTYGVTRSSPPSIFSTRGQAWRGSGKPESLVNGHGKARTPVTRYALDQGLEFLEVLI